MFSARNITISVSLFTALFLMFTAGAYASSHVYILENPLGTNVDKIESVACLVVNFLSRNLMPPIAVLMVLWASFLFLTAGADPTKVNMARQILVWMAVGVLILILAPALTALVVNLFGGATGTTPASPYCEPQAAADTVVDTLVRLVNWFSWLLAVLATAVGLYAGFLFMTAGGEAQKLMVARNVLFYAVVGVIVAVLAFGIITIVSSLVL